MEGRAKRSKQQITKKDFPSLEHGCMADIIHPGSLLLGRRCKQTMEMPYILTNCLTMNIICSLLHQAPATLTPTCQTLNAKWHSISGLDPKLLTALKITFDCHFILSAILILSSRPSYRDRVIIIQEKGRISLAVSPHISLRSGTTISSDVPSSFPLGP